MNEKLANLFGTKFVGFILAGFALGVALAFDKLDGNTFAQNVVTLFLIYAGGNAVATVGGAVSSAIKAKATKPTSGEGGA